MKRRRGRRHLAHRTIAEELVADLGRREDEWNGARCEQVLDPYSGPHADALRALPQLEARSAHAEAHRHAGAIARCSDGQRIECACADAVFDRRKVNGPRQKRRQRRIVEQRDRPLAVGAGKQRAQEAPCRLGKVPSIRTINVLDAECRPCLAQHRRRGAEMARACRERGGIDRPCRGSANDPKRAGSAVGQHFSDCPGHAGLIRGSSAPARKDERQLGFVRHGCRGSRQSSNS